MRAFSRIGRPRRRAGPGRRAQQPHLRGDEQVCTTTDEPVIGTGFSPTLLEAVGAKPGRDALYRHFPGYLQAYGPGLWRTSPVSMVRSGDWKLLTFYEGTRVELYNLAEDLCETYNLADERPEKREQLLTRLNEWLRARDAPLPIPKQE